MLYFFKILGILLREMGPFFSREIFYLLWGLRPRPKLPRPWAGTEAIAATSTLELASDLGFSKVVLEGDCQVLMHALIYESPFLSSDGLLIDDVR